ncbi:kinase-like domain-containing protein [Sordaria brevicollis]|uniref:Kinase-like domain-containing protein n=1 Tax=Sordaria brevicollis TaxID=83679 RepID=A0AAE0U0B8_SORBR|nr:kinase-like domain-containing protein [Sordaria brevicollis]
MEQQWQPYSDSAASGSSRRYNNGSGQMSMSPRDYTNNGQVPSQQQHQQQQPPAGYKYDPYQAAMNPGAQPQSSSISPMTSSQSRDSNGDVAMQDAHDQYSSQNPTIKYPLRPHHSLSGGRPASLSTSQEPSAAAQRYSPMEALSPASQYPKGSQFSPAQRQSPTRPNEYAPPQSQHQQQQQQTNPYYSSRQTSQQLPPINPYAPANTTTAIQTRRRMNSQSQQMPNMPDKTPVPEFKKVRGPQDLRPRINKQPAHRRANPEGGFISVSPPSANSHLPATYRICNPNFKYESSRNPRRVLTKPSKGVKNDGYDNEDSDYILYVNNPGLGGGGHKNRYLILDTQEVVAVKVIKNRTAYLTKVMMEVSVLDLLNTKLDKNDDHHLLRLKDTFIHRQHLCLVFELLSVNLYELIKQNQFRGLSTTLVRPIIKIIDFGSACDERQTVYTYIQSRFYRSPEVLLGLPYSSAIDMWSLGCIVVELFLMLGNPPNWMIEMGQAAGEFFEKRQDEFGRKTYHLKSMEQYSREHGTKEQPSKKYFQANTLPEIIKTYPMPRKNMKQSEIDREMNNRIAFIDFVRGLLTINPLERWSPQQAKLHPFITQSKFTGPFVPPMNLKSSSLNRSPAPGTQQQIQAEAFSKQKAQQAQANAIAANQAQNPYGGSSSHGGAPPPYGSQQGQYPQQGMPQQQQQQQQVPQVQMPPGNYSGMSQSSVYAQQQAAAAARQRQRSSTMEQQQSGIPVSIQRVASHLDPTQPIRLQPSPAYYPPPPDGLAGMDSQPSQRMPRRGSRAQQGGRGQQGNNRDFIRNLEERTLEEGFMGNSGGGGGQGQGQSPWH